MPVLSLDQAVEEIARLRDSGLGAQDSGLGRGTSSAVNIVFTNGVFDLLHPGHVRYLRAARDQGAFLIVGMNTDRSVRTTKGPSRPIVPEAERAEVVAALACVDAVLLFDEPTPAEIVERLQPDVLVKGADWPADQIVGRETVERRGGRVVRIPVEAGYSTTGIVEKIRHLERRT